MKWLFFALLIVNLSLAAFQWVKQREQAVVPVFEQSSEVSRISLLSDGLRSEDGEVLKGKRCMLSGPIEKGEALDSIRGLVAAELEGVTVVEHGQQKAPAYWVYISSKNVGEDTLSKLQATGIDFYKIGSGELKGSYSLGVFDNVDLARGLVKKIKKEGLSSQIKEKKKQEITYWLEYELEYAAENQEKISNIAAFLPKGVKKTEIFCKSVASEK